MKTMLKRNTKKRRRELKKAILRDLKKINEALANVGSDIVLYLIRAGKKYKIIDKDNHIVHIHISKGIVSIKKEQDTSIVLGHVKSDIIDISQYIVQNYHEIKGSKPLIIKTADNKWKVSSVSFKDGNMSLSFIPASKRFPLIITDREYAENIVKNSDKNLHIEEFSYQP